MKKTDKIKLQKLTHQELSKQLLVSQKELIELTVKHSLEPVKDTSVFTKNKYKISFLKSLIGNYKHE